MRTHATTNWIAGAAASLLVTPGSIVCGAGEATAPILETRAALVPAAVDLGNAEAGSTHPGAVWLINRSNEPLEVLGAKGNCGCVRLVDFVPTTLGPHAAREVRFTMTVPDNVGAKKTKKLAFRFGDERTLTVPITVEAVSGAPLRPVAEVGALRVAPAKIDLGRLQPETIGPATAWLINTGHEPLHISSAKATCGCVTLDFSPCTVEPGRAIEVPLAVSSPAEHGRTKSVGVVFAVANHSAVRLPVTIAAIDATVRTPPNTDP